MMRGTWKKGKKNVNFRVYMMALATVAVGLVELIVGGILPSIADEFNVSLSTAGQLITVFAFVFAIAGPVLLALTSEFERKKLYLMALFVFFIGNIITFFSPTFTVMMIARVITAASTALVIVLSLTIAVKIVAPTHRAKAIGVISMGISSSLVLGVPIGIMITNAFGWRYIFLAIAVLSIGSMILISVFLEAVPGEKMIPLRQQLKTLKSSKVMSAHLAILLMLTGHFTLYAYFRPFLESTMDLNATLISLCYLLFGVAAVSGGAIGGTLSDNIGPKKSMIIVLSVFALSMAILPFTTFSLISFIPVMMIWGALSWGLSPAMQSYIIEIDPKTAPVQQSFNNSALQIGISVGSIIGGVLLEQTGSVASMPFVGSFIVVIALGFALFSFSRTYPSV